MVHALTIKKAATEAALFRYSIAMLVSSYEYSSSLMKNNPHPFFDLLR